jgi:hypothetical protein
VHQKNKIYLPIRKELSTRKAGIFVSLLAPFFSVHPASAFCTFYFAFELYRHS